jgi:hypothetical protein
MFVIERGEEIAALRRQMKEEIRMNVVLEVSIVVCECDVLGVRVVVGPKPAAHLRPVPPNCARSAALGVGISLGQLHSWPRIEVRQLPLVVHRAALGDTGGRCLVAVIQNDAA